LYRWDNIFNSRVDFTTATSFEQKTKVWQHFNVEYSGLLEDSRLKLFWTYSLFSSYPQYQSALNYYNAGSAVGLFNKIWNKLGIYFNDYFESGMYFVSGADFRIPKLEINSITSAELSYRFASAVISKWAGFTGAGALISESPDSFFVNSLGGLGSLVPVEKVLYMHNLSLNFKEEIRWSKIKQTTTFPVGNVLSGSFKFYLPTKIGILNDDFRFKFKVEDRFYHKFFREFAFKGRLIAFVNYNINDDYSGDPFVRGFVSKELTGFTGLLGNIELYIPVLNVDIKEAGNMPLKKDAKFLLYLVAFVDGGFTVDNFNWILENAYLDSKRSQQYNNYQANLGNNFYLTPAISAGGGVRLYPYFLNFIIRLDVSVNIIKAAYFNQSTFDLLISFTEMF